MPPVRRCKFIENSAKLRELCFDTSFPIFLNASVLPALYFAHISPLYITLIVMFWVSDKRCNIEAMANVSNFGTLS